MFAIVFPQIDPIIFSVGFISVRWYGLAYAVGMLLCLYLIQKFSVYRFKKFPSLLPITHKQIDSFAIYVVLGIVLGGRLGFVAFYRPQWFLERPLMILNTLEGGMSFHGALLGIIIAISIFCKRHKVPFFELTDLICSVAPIGLFFGRCANFINGELYGRITNVSWGVIFPGETFPRHASQLYEAMTEGLLLLFIMLILFFKTNLSSKKGSLSGVFLVGYSIARIFVEQYREPDAQMSYLGFLTTGQALTVPMLIAGLGILFYERLQK